MKAEELRPGLVFQDRGATPEHPKYVALMELPGTGRWLVAWENGGAASAVRTEFLLEEFEVAP